MTRIAILALVPLLERVKAATGPDRALECDLVEAFISASEAGAHFNFDLAAYRYTASIDAALALVERVLPGWQVNVSAFGNVAEASLGGRGVYPPIQAPTPPLAILVALLTAIISKEPS
jgi:hypothetical protein